MLSAQRSLLLLLLLPPLLTITTTSTTTTPGPVLLLQGAENTAKHKSLTVRRKSLWITDCGLHNLASSELSWRQGKCNTCLLRIVTRESLLLTIDHLLWGGIYTYPHPQPLSPNKVKEPTGVRAKAPLHVLLYFTGLFISDSIMTVWQKVCLNSNFSFPFFRPQSCSWPPHSNRGGEDGQTPPSF